eukprot:TRINITY_DN34246_c0_g1_i1.p1 TRINITY_DN34246_c0_g1~~TRINITY_DN34246_c0_g1_i1.p1  ORF type:complete len:730 (+),score=174.03 TRINITY_DN34246_c0_g1_i1:51-2240(+)
MAASKNYRYLALQVQKVLARFEKRLLDEGLFAWHSLGSAEPASPSAHSRKTLEDSDDLESHGSSPEGAHEDPLETSTFGKKADPHAAGRAVPQEASWAGVEIGVQALADVIASQMRHALRQWVMHTRRRRLEDLQSTVMMALHGMPGGSPGRGARQGPQAAHAHSVASKVAEAAARRAPVHSHRHPVINTDAEDLHGREHASVASRRSSPSHVRGSLAMAALASEALEECSGSLSFAPESSRVSPVRSPAHRSEVAGVARLAEALVETAKEDAAAGPSLASREALAASSHGSPARSGGLEASALVHDTLVDAALEARFSPTALAAASRGRGQVEDAVAAQQMRGILAEEFAAVHQPREVSRSPAESRALVEQVLRGPSSQPNSARRQNDSDFVKSLCADQARVDEIIKLATLLWDSGALQAHAKPLPLLKASLLARTAERCQRHALREAFQLLWKRSSLKRSVEELLAKGELVAKPAAGSGVVDNGGEASAYLLEGGHDSAARVGQQPSSDAAGGVHQPDADHHARFGHAGQEALAATTSSSSSPEDRAAALEAELQESRARERAAAQAAEELKSAEAKARSLELEARQEIERLREQLRAAEAAAAAPKREVVSQPQASQPQASQAQPRATQDAVHTRQETALDESDDETELPQHKPEATAALAGAALIEGLGSSLDITANSMEVPKEESRDDEDVNLSALGVLRDSDADDDDSDHDDINDDELADLLG